MGKFDWGPGDVTIIDPKKDRPARTKFSDLKTGDRFVFDDDRAARPEFSRTYGPFRKVSERRYRMTDGCIAPIDSVGFFVVKVGD